MRAFSFPRLEYYQENQEADDPIIELADDSEESVWWGFSGMALAGCPSSKDVARIASQKSIDKSNQSNVSESEEEEEEGCSEEESDEDEDPKAAEEKRLQRELKLLKTKIKSFK